MNKINKTLDEAVGELTVERVESILSVMCEGGISYWADLEYDKEEYQKVKQRLIDGGMEGSLSWELVLAQILISGGKLGIIEQEDGAAHELTLDKLKHGIELWFLNPRYHEDTNEWEEVDAEGADVICQFAIFDDIIYG